MKKIFLRIAVLLFLTVSISFAQKIRSPVVAGSFYPGDAAELKSFIDNSLKKASEVKLDGKIVAVISPHAGYKFSGQVAADMYKLLKGKKFDVVCVIAPSHREAFEGVSIYSGDGYRTPLGGRANKAHRVGGLPFLVWQDI